MVTVITNQVALSEVVVGALKNELDERSIRGGYYTTRPMEPFGLIHQYYLRIGG